MPKKREKAPLSQNEARLVAMWLESLGKVLQGFLVLWNLTPDEVAAQYGVDKEQVLVACRRK